MWIDSSNLSQQCPSRINATIIAIIKHVILKKKERYGWKFELKFYLIRPRACCESCVDDRAAPFDRIKTRGDPSP